VGKHYQKPTFFNQKKSGMFHNNRIQKQLHEKHLKKVGKTHPKIKNVENTTTLQI
jgi:hypothetical protein